MLGAQHLDAEKLGLAGLVRRMLRGAVFAAHRAAVLARATRATCRERLGQHHRRARNLRLKARKRAHQRAQVEVQRERCAGAGTGNAHDGRAVDNGEAGVVPGAVVRLVADHLPHLLHDLARPVIAALRRAGVEHHDVGQLHRAGDDRLDGVAAIGHNVERHELAAPLLAFRAHQHAVRLEVLAASRKRLGAFGVERHARGNKLVARGDKRHARAAHHGHGTVVAAAHARGDVGRHQRTCRAQHVAATHGRAHRARARALRRRRRIDNDMLFICGNLHVLNHNGRVEAFGHGHARVRELPVAPAHPRAGVGHFAFGQAFEVRPMQRHGIHGARQRVRHVGLRHHVVGQHASDRLGQRNLLHQLARNLARVHLVGRRTCSGRQRAAPAETVGLRVQHGQRFGHRFFARQLYMLRMVSHVASFRFASSSVYSQWNTITIALSYRFACFYFERQSLDFPLARAFAADVYCTA